MLFFNSYNYLLNNNSNNLFLNVFFFASCSSKIVVQLGDHVVIKGEKTGRIRYIGHLDKIGQPNMVFVGLELDAPGNFSVCVVGFSVSLYKVLSLVITITVFQYLYLNGYLYRVSITIVYSSFKTLLIYHSPITLFV